MECRPEDWVNPYNHKMHMAYEGGDDAILEALYNSQVGWIRLDKTDAGDILIFTGRE